MAGVSSGAGQRRMLVVACLVSAIVAAALAAVPATAAPPQPPAAVDPSPAIRVVDTPGPTEVSGNILTDTVWGPRGSPYVVDAAVFHENATLTILPGTVVKFRSSTSSLQVDGQILALGNAQDRITFTSFKDDSVGGDTNDDGVATSPARGDWRQIRIGGSRALSVLDFVDVRYGGTTSGRSCPSDPLAGTVWAHGSSSKVLISNSSVTNSLVSGVVAGDNGPGSYLGIHDSHFGDSRCGVAVTSSRGRIDVVGNTFDPTFDTAAFSSATVRDLRFWFNDVKGKILTTDTTREATRSEIDIRYNTLSGGVATIGIEPFQFQDYRSNWWGSDANLPLPSCMTASEANAHSPPIRHTAGGGCPAGEVRPTGYARTIAPALSGAPAAMPLALSRWQSPSYGPVDTARGTVTYQVDDFSVEDAGKALTARRTYSSERASGDVGRGWSSAFTEAVSQVPGVTTMTLSDQSMLPFPLDPANGFTPARGVSASYTSDQDGISIGTPDDTTYRFDPAGVLSTIVLGDPGHEIDVDHADGEVSKVTGSSGRFLRFDRDAGRLVNIEDSQGRSVLLGYDENLLTSATGVDGGSETYRYSNGRLDKVTTASGVPTFELSYGSDGRVEWVELAGSGRTRLSYRPGVTTLTAEDDTVTTHHLDARDRLVSESVRGGSSRHVVYDGDGRVLSTIDGIPSEPMTGYRPAAVLTMYDENGDLVKQVDPIGRTTDTRYDNRHNPTRIENPDGGVTTYEYDGDGRVTASTDPAGNRWGFETNGRGQLVKVRDPLGRSRTTSYTDDGDLRSETDELGATTKYGTDARGWISSVTDPVGDTTRYDYTAWGQVRRFEKPGGARMATSFDADRRPVRLTDARGHETGYAYDAAGRLRTVTDPRGGTTTYTYDVLGRPASSTSARGAVHSQTYTPNGWVHRTEGPDGTSVEYGRDPSGRPARVTDAMGQVTQTVFDAAGQTVRIQTPDGGSQTFAYSALGQLQAQTNAIGGATRHEYDSRGNLTKTTDPLGFTDTRTYDAIGREVGRVDRAGTPSTMSYDDDARSVTVSDPIGVVEKITSDPAGRTVSVADGRGATTAYAYGADGRLSSTTSATGSRTAFEYDLTGNLVSQTDARGNTVRARYDSLNRLGERTHPDGSKEKFGYDPAGNLVERVDRTGATWRHEFDLSNRHRRTTDPDGGRTTYDLDVLGRSIEVTDPTGVSVRTGFDPVGRPAVVTDRAGASTVLDFDKAGNVLKQTGPDGASTTNTYDARSQLRSTTVTGAGQHPVNFTYDRLGNLVRRDQGTQRYQWGYDVRSLESTFTDARGKLTTYHRDRAGNLTKQTEPSGRATAWTYDLEGRPLSAVDAGGATSGYEYDPVGNLTKVTLPTGGEYTFTHDADGRVSSQTTPLDQTTRFEHDPLGRLTRTTRPSGEQVTSTHDTLGREVTRIAGGERREFAYDAAGRLTLARAAAGDLTFDYDDRGLLTTSTSASGTTTFEHDSVRRPSRVTHPGGQSAAYGYDAAGRLSSVRGTTNLNLTYNAVGDLAARTAVAPTAHATATFSRDADGRVLAATYGTGSTIRTTYDDDGRTSSSDVALAGVANPAEGQYEYRRDDAGRLVGAVHRSGGSIVGQETYGWDGNGNRTSKGKSDDPPVATTFNLANQPTSSSDGTEHEYDEDGDLVRVEAPDGDVTRYRYNALGEMTGAEVAGKDVAFVRDALGRVQERRSGSDETMFGYEGERTVPSSTRSGDVTTTMIRDADANLLSLSAGASLTHAMTNNHGDLVGTRAQSGGALTSTSVYSPFGERTDTGTRSSQLAFQSMVQDPTTGLVDMAARQYSPASGAFTSEDTVVGDLRAPVSLNRYSYAQASPLDMVDLDGRWPSLVAAGKKVWGGVERAGRAVVAAAGHVARAVTTAARVGAQAVASASSGARRLALASYDGTREALQSGARALQQSTSQLRADLEQKASSAVRGIRAHVEALDLDMETVHTGLDVAGLVPVLGEPADALNAGLYLLEGDTKNALISFGAMAVGIGAAVGIARAAKARQGTATTSVRTSPESAKSLISRADTPMISSWHPKGGASRFIGNGAGDLLDTTRITVPEDKFGYLLRNPSKSGIFRDSMGFDQMGLSSALPQHLITNFGNASTPVPMTGGGTKFVTHGPLTGPSGRTWNIKSVWGVDVDGTIRLITATPGAHL